MHVVHILAAYADPHTCDDGTVQALLDEYSASDTWWDWFEVGGRWDGYFAQWLPELSGALANSNVLPVPLFPSEALQALEGIQRTRNEVFLSHRDKLTGAVVHDSAGSMDGHLFGLPVSDSKEAADRQTAVNQGYAAEWQTVLTTESLNDLTGQWLMSLYYARRVVDMVEGRWHSDAYFHSLVPEVGSLEDVMNAIRGGQSLMSESGVPLCLIAVDFHF